MTITHTDSELDTATDNEDIRPDYYKTGIETWDYIEDKGLNFNLGNATKYISRAGKKELGTLKYREDLVKARTYIDREITLIDAGRR